MTGRALHLHVGHGKTGSSYLQSWLAVNAEVLARRHGLAYPQRSPVTQRVETDARRGLFSMGNGFVLEDLLGSGSAGRAATSLRELAAGRSVVFSCERFMKSLAGRLAQVERLALEAGLTGVRYLLFVRDPLEHALSLYAEMVKAHGYVGSADDWLDEYDLLDHVERFLAERARCPGSELTVVNYSRVARRVLEPLGAWLGVDPSGAGLHPPPRARVNRSLTPLELRLQRQLNRILGPRAAPLGRLLVGLRPARPSGPPQASSEARETFLRRLGAQLERLGRQLPEAARYAPVPTPRAPSGA